MRPLNLLPLFLVLLVAGPLGAQQAGGITACVFPIANGSGEAAFDGDGRAIGEAVRAEFEAAGYLVTVPDEAAGSAAVVHGEAGAAAAAAAGADIAVTGLFAIDAASESISLSVDCWQRDGTLMAGFDLAERFGLNFYNVLHDRMATLIGKVKTVTGAPRIDSLQLAAVKGLGQITFSIPQDGVEVFLAGEKSLGTSAGGALTAPVGLLQGGSDLALELRMPGYHPQRLLVPATPDVQLPALQRANRFAVEAGWTSAQPLGIGAALLWYPVADWVFLGLPLHVGAQLPPPGATGQHAVAHLDTGVRAGVYLLPYDTRIPFVPDTSPLRLRVGLSVCGGVYGTFSAAAGMPALWDWYFGPPMPFLEVGTEPVVFFIRMEQRYSFGFGGGALGRGWIMIETQKSGGGTDTRPPVILGVTWKW